MRKYLALLFTAVILATTGCTTSNTGAIQTSTPQAATATAIPTATPSAAPTETPAPTATATVAPTTQPLDTNLASLLTMTRKDVTALYGAGKPVPFSDISDYNESSYELSGFPCEYSKLNGVLVFYDAKPQAEDAAPYYCTESPNDHIVGISLPSGSSPYHVNGNLGNLTKADLDNLTKEHKAKTEHINGMYEYYKVSATYGGNIYIWDSNTEDMANATLYVQLDKPSAAQTTAPSISGLLLLVPVLVDNVKTVSTVNRPDGTYYEELLYDGTVSIVTERLTNIKFDKKTIAKQISTLDGMEISDIKVESDAAVSKQLSYPAWRITYTTGTNEDTRTNVDIYIQTDSWDFRFHTSTPADSYSDYTENIESWIMSMSVSDMSN